MYAEKLEGGGERDRWMFGKEYPPNLEGGGCHREHVKREKGGYRDTGRRSPQGRAERGRCKEGELTNTIGGRTSAAFLQEGTSEKRWGKVIGTRGMEKLQTSRGGRCLHGKGICH